MNQNTVAWKIVAFVSRVFRVKVSKVLSKSRVQKHTAVRQRCMWLLHSIADAPVSKIAKFFRRSKSTVSFSIGKIQDLLRCDSVPSAFKFKSRFFALLCMTLRKYVRLIGVKIPMLPKKERMRRAKFGGVI